MLTEYQVITLRWEFCYFLKSKGDINKLCLNSIELDSCLTPMLKLRRTGRRNDVYSIPISIFYHDGYI